MEQSKIDAVKNLVNIPPIPMPERDMSRYNGGCTDLGNPPWSIPLPYPEEGKKWAVRWHDTITGAILPDIVQVDMDEELSTWYDGYPKFDV